MSQLRLGLAGVGRFGQLRAAVLSALPNVTLAAIADPCKEGCQHVADRHQVARRYGSTQELFDDADLDAFILVTSDELHGNQGLAAVAKGKPVFIENRWLRTPSRPWRYRQPPPPQAPFCTRV